MFGGKPPEYGRRDEVFTSVCITRRVTSSTFCANTWSGVGGGGGGGSVGGAGLTIPLYSSVALVRYLYISLFIASAPPRNNSHLFPCLKRLPAVIRIVRTIGMITRM